MQYTVLHTVICIQHLDPVNFDRIFLYFRRKFEIVVVFLLFNRPYRKQTKSNIILTVETLPMFGALNKDSLIQFEI